MPLASASAGKSDLVLNPEVTNTVGSNTKYFPSIRAMLLGKYLPLSDVMFVIQSLKGQMGLLSERYG